MFSSFNIEFLYSRDSVKHQSLDVSINLLILHFAFCILHLEVVGQNGLEPSTSRLSVVCSSQLSYWPVSLTSFGGEYRDRTGDLLLARQALSQLS